MYCTSAPLHSSVLHHCTSALLQSSASQQCRVLMDLFAQSSAANQDLQRVSRCLRGYKTLFWTLDFTRMRQKIWTSTNNVLHFETDYDVKIVEAGKYWEATVGGASWLWEVGKVLQVLKLLQALKCVWPQRPWSWPPPFLLLPPELNRSSPNEVWFRASPRPTRLTFKAVRD